MVQVNAQPLVESVGKRAGPGFLTCACCSGKYIHRDNIADFLHQYSSGGFRSAIFLTGMQHDAHWPITRHPLILLS